MEPTMTIQWENAGVAGWTIVRLEIVDALRSQHRRESKRPTARLTVSWRKQSKQTFEFERLALGKF